MKITVLIIVLIMSRLRIVGKRKISVNMLTRLAISRFTVPHTSGHSTCDHQAIVQVLHVKRILTGGPSDRYLRYRVILSDGQYYIQAIFGPQCTSLVHNREIKQFTIIRVKEFTSVTVAKTPICVVIQCDVMRQMNNGIGKPVNIINLKE